MVWKVKRKDNADWVKRCMTMEAAPELERRDVQETHDRMVQTD